jgi:hypothetical protein
MRLRLLHTLPLLLPIVAQAQTVTQKENTPPYDAATTVPANDGSGKTLRVPLVASIGGSAQGSTTMGQGGTLSLCTAVTGNQTYIVGTSNPLNCITTGRLKVGVSSAGNVDPATMLSTTLTSDLIGCKSYATRAAWADQYQGSLQCDFFGNLYTTPGPVAGTTAQGVTAVVIKATAGALYSINIVNSTAAGYIVVYNASAAPASGATLAAASTPYCYQLAASSSYDKGFTTPLLLSTGVTLLFSTSCTTYTPVGTAPITLSGQAK